MISAIESPFSSIVFTISSVRKDDFTGSWFKFDKAIVSTEWRISTEY